MGEPHQPSSPGSDRGQAPQHTNVLAAADPSAAGFYARMSGAYGSRRSDVVLRVLDVVISASLLLALSPVLALVALLVLVTSGPPVLYRGERVGRGGLSFTMFKFRTLRRGAETRLGNTYGLELTSMTPRETTWIGRPLRATHLDEIPQLWNVLRGEMSMVGPRPIRPAFLAEVSNDFPQYWQRLVVRPGVTGFAQTRITREDAWEYKLAHDLEYIADRSLSLYLQVIMATARRVLDLSVRGGWQQVRPSRVR
jgi:lipopolysaccharide/colanic/teichoic acid biosynthesis glycosyltransferase